MQLSLGGSRGWEQRVHSSKQSCEQSCHHHHSSDSSRRDGDKSTVFLLPPGWEGKGKRKTRHPSRFANSRLNEGIEHIPP